MKELLERVVSALEESNKIMARSVEQNAEWYNRHQRMDELTLENTTLSIERYHYLRMRELLTFFSLAGEDRADILPSLYEAYGKWKDAVRRIGSDEGIDYSLIERTYLHALEIARQAVLGQLTKQNTDDAVKDLMKTLEAINKFTGEENGK